MKRVTKAPAGSTCAHPVLATRDSTKEPCHCNAEVLIDGIPYCSVHADETYPRWKSLLNTPVSGYHRDGLGLMTDAAAIDQ